MGKRKHTPRQSALQLSAANDQHFMIVFAAQPPSNRPRHAHSFATFVAASEGRVSAQTSISWLPKTMVIRLFARPQPGTNFDIRTTIDWVLKTKDSRVSAWGAVRIHEELYDSALRRAADLSENYSYQAVDFDFGLANVTNCIHALSDLDLFPSPLSTNLARGERASRMIVNRFKPWILEPTKTYPWVIEALELSNYSIRFLEV